jgi:hypothetical protein
VDLNGMMEIQRALCADLWRDGPDVTTADGRAEVLRRNVLGAHSELGEVLDAAAGWKPHRAGVPADGLGREAVLEECVDVVKYVLGILVAYGFTAAEVAAMFRTKSELVAARLREERALSAMSALPSVAVVRAEGLLYDREALLDAHAAPGQARASLRPAEAEALRLRAYRAPPWSWPLLPGAADLVRGMSALWPGALVVASDAPGSSLEALPSLRAVLDRLGPWRIGVGGAFDRVPSPTASRGWPPGGAVYVAEAERLPRLARVLPVACYVTADAADANRALGEGVRRVHSVGDSRTARASLPGVRCSASAAEVLDRVRDQVTLDAPPGAP